MDDHACPFHSENWTAAVHAALLNAHAAQLHAGWVLIRYEHIQIVWWLFCLLKIQFATGKYKLHPGEWGGLSA
eukprot:359602-Chlamydomonas_euryale.AAC.5